MLLEKSSRLLKNKRNQSWLRGGWCQRLLSFLVDTSTSVTLCYWLSCSSITITTSCFPVPSICFRDPVNDWFESLAQCLHWNVRKKQNYISSEDEFWALWSLWDSDLVLVWPCSVPCCLVQLKGRRDVTKFHNLWFYKPILIYNRDYSHEEV